MRAVPVDTGPIVALLDRSDRHHQQIVQALDDIEDPLVTVWPVVVEAMYLLAFSFRAKAALFEILETGAIQFVDLDAADIPTLKRLMEKYRDLPMDVADAALVCVAEREEIRRVLTLHRRDFAVYRLSRKGKFTILPTASRQGSRRCVS